MGDAKTARAVLDRVSQESRKLETANTVAPGRDTALSAMEPAIDRLPTISCSRAFVIVVELAGRSEPIMLLEGEKR
jgi:hypothetical protein